MAYHLLVRVHRGPAPLALLLHGTLGGLRAKVIGNDGPGVLHVEEVGRQGPLGGVGVVRALLTLLLLLDRRAQVGHGVDELGGGTLKVGEKVAVGALGRGLTQQKVSLPDVVGSEGAEELEDGGEATDGLGVLVVCPLSAASSE